jgi:hypothetical protein
MFVDFVNATCEVNEEKCFAVYSVIAYLSTCTCNFHYTPNELHHTVT